MRLHATDSYRIISYRIDQVSIASSFDRHRSVIDRSSTLPVSFRMHKRGADPVSIYYNEETHMSLVMDPGFRTLFIRNYRMYHTATRHESSILPVVLLFFVYLLFKSLQHHHSFYPSFLYIITLILSIYTLMIWSLY